MHVKFMTSLLQENENLKMIVNDLYLVVVIWRDVGNLVNNMLNKKTQLSLMEII